MQRAVSHVRFWIICVRRTDWQMSRKRAQTSVALTPPILSLFCSSLSTSLCHSLDTPPFTIIDKWSPKGVGDWQVCCDNKRMCVHTDTHTDDWQAWHQSVTPQWLPVRMFLWHLVGSSPISSMCSLIMNQWQAMSGHKTVFFFLHREFTISLNAQISCCLCWNLTVKMTQQNVMPANHRSHKHHGRIIW